VAPFSDHFLQVLFNYFLIPEDGELLLYGWFLLPGHHKLMKACMDIADCLKQVESEREVEAGGVYEPIQGIFVHLLDEMLDEYGVVVQVLARFQELPIACIEDLLWVLAGTEGVGALHQVQVYDALDVHVLRDILTRIVGPLVEGGDHYEGIDVALHFFNGEIH